MAGARRLRRFTWGVALVGLLSAALGGTARADIIHVYEGESIQAAIQASHTGDVIIVHPGLYLDNINPLGNTITIRSIDPTDPAIVASTIIDAQGQGSVVTCTSHEVPETVISGFTITGGSGSLGGGMKVMNISHPTVTHCVFTGNHANSWGGGLLAWDYCNITVVNCAFIGNTSSKGAGVYAQENSSTFTNCLFKGNYASVYGGGVA